MIACLETDYNDLYVHEDTPSRARYDLKRLPQDLMSSETAKLAISNLISKIQSVRETQTKGIADMKIYVALLRQSYTSAIIGCN